MVVTDRDRLADFTADLDPNDVGLDQGSAGKCSCPQISDERRQNHRARMRRHHRQHVIEIQGMAKGPVDERRHLRRHGPATPQDRAGAAVASLFDIAHERRCNLASSAGENDRKRIGQRFLGLVEGRRGEVLQRLVMDELRQRLSQSSHRGSLV